MPNADFPYLDDLGRPFWDIYFMSLCFLVSQRSIDPRTKHGSVAAAPDHTILSTGYNGPAGGCTDTLIPLDPPAKYDWLGHAELAVISNAAKSGTPLGGAIFYVTGFPCPICFREMARVGAKEVIYGPVKSWCTEIDNDVIGVVKEMSAVYKVPLISYHHGHVDSLLNKAAAYYADRSKWQREDIV